MNLNTRIARFKAWRKARRHPFKRYCQRDGRLLVRLPGSRFVCLKCEREYMFDIRSVRNARRLTASQNRARLPATGVEQTGSSSGP